MDIDALNQLKKDINLPDHQIFLADKKTSLADPTAANILESYVAMDFYNQSGKHLGYIDGAFHQAVSPSSLVEPTNHLSDDTQIKSPMGKYASTWWRPTATTMELVGVGVTAAMIGGPMAAICVTAAFAVKKALDMKSAQDDYLKQEAIITQLKTNSAFTPSSAASQKIASPHTQSTEPPLTIATRLPIG